MPLLIAFFPPEEPEKGHPIWAWPRHAKLSPGYISRLARSLGGRRPNELRPDVPRLANRLERHPGPKTLRTLSDGIGDGPHSQTKVGNFRLSYRSPQVG